MKSLNWLPGRNTKVINIEGTEEQYKNGYIDKIFPGPIFYFKEFVTIVRELRLPLVFIFFLFFSSFSTFSFSQDTTKWTINLIQGEKR